MKRFWEITLAALLVAISTTDVASACGWGRGLFGRRYAYQVAATYGAYGGWSVGSTAGSVSRDLPTCAGGACVVEKKDDAAEASAAPACSGGACDVERKTDAAETSTPATPPACPGGTCPTGACETTAVPTCSAETNETVDAPTCAAQTTLEREIALGLRLVEAANRSRLAEGLRPLQLDERFADGARAHSRLMAAWRSCFHQYPPTPEICAAWQTSPEAAVRAWEFSDDHKTIMHGARYTKVAPGVAYDAEGRLYWTLRIW
ncbi:MAG: CAP domain-containing protein [Thermoguttaceae bacterium]|nr:CAP domain-containing protein [Thermoguttaceae bacterium]